MNDEDLTTEAELAVDAIRKKFGKSAVEHGISFKGKS